VRFFSLFFFFFVSESAVTTRNHSHLVNPPTFAGDEKNTAERSECLFFVFCFLFFVFLKTKTRESVSRGSVIRGALTTAD
jgi:hypothetical protein